MKRHRQKFPKVTQPRRLKICLGIPCVGTVRIETLLSVVAILNSTPHDIYVAWREGAYIEQNRTRLIQTAIEQKCEKLFFLDSDIMVEPNVINKLLAHNKPFIAANYNHRSFPLRSNVKFMENGEFIAVPELPHELFKCAAVPTGAMLIDIPTVQKIPHPWFDLEYFEDGSLRIGEDVYFCLKAIEHGYEIWCDPLIEIGHIGTFTY
jgi:GT2 family glycosyltransferase